MLVLTRSAGESVHLVDAAGNTNRITVRQVLRTGAAEIQITSPYDVVGVFQQIHTDQRFDLGSCEILVVKVKPTRVRLGFDAPRSTRITRGEILELSDRARRSGSGRLLDDLRAGRNLAVPR